MPRRCRERRRQTALPAAAQILPRTREQKGKREPSQVCANSRKEAEHEPHRAPGITDLVDFHEFGVGARPFYGHLDDVRGWWHREPGQHPKPVRLGSRGAGGHTCLSLRRNDKKRKKVAQCTRKAGSAASLPVFTGGLGIRNGSGHRRHWAPTAPPAAPGRRARGGEGASALQSQLPGDRARQGQLPDPSGGKRGAPPRGSVPLGAQGPSEQDALCPEKRGNLAFVRQPPEGHIAQEVMVRKQGFFKVFSVTNRALRYSNQDVTRKGPGSRSTHRHTRCPQAGPRPSAPPEQTSGSH